MKKRKKEKKKKMHGQCVRRHENNAIFFASINFNKNIKNKIHIKGFK
jgi:hypothetical protein